MDREDTFSKLANQAALIAAALVLAECCLIGSHSGLQVLLNALYFALFNQFIFGSLLGITAFTMVALASINCLGPGSKTKWLVAVPWLFTLATLIWGAFWAQNWEIDPSRELAEQDKWALAVIGIALMASFCSWLSLLFMSKTAGWRYALAGILQLAFQTVIAFMAAMVTSNVSL